MNQEDKFEMKEIIMDVLRGIVIALVWLAFIVAVHVLIKAKCELREAEREADAAHAARVIFEGGRSSCE